MAQHSMVEYYDYVLGLIPLTAVTVAGLLTLAGISSSLALPVGVGLTLPLVGHALFVRTPASRPVQPPAESDSAMRDDATPNTAD